VGVGDGVGVGFGGSSGSAVGRGVGVGDGVAVGVGTRRGVGVGAAEIFSAVELPTCVSASPEMTRIVAINNGPIFFNIRPPYSVNTGAISSNGRALTVIWESKIAVIRGRQNTKPEHMAADLP